MMRLRVDAVAVLLASALAAAIVRPAYPAPCADCCSSTCGDGILDPGEACDDENLANGDGCSASCAPEQFTTAFPGSCVTSGAPSNEEGRDGVLLGDGSLVVAGGASLASCATNAFSAVLARYRSDGTLDEDFGNGSGRAIPTQAASFGANAIGLQTVDGVTRIIIAGSAAAGSTSSMALSRLTLGGVVDSNFGTGGVTTVDFGSGTTSGASDLLVLPDGRLLTVGFRRAANDSDFAIVRLSANGVIEDSRTRHFDSSNDLATSAVLAPDGKIVVVGRNGGLILPLGTTSFVVMRLLPDGLTPDASFDQDGATLVSAGAGCCYGANDAVVQPDGAIVIVGRELLPGGVFGFGRTRFALVRLLENGSPDPSFGDQGRRVDDPISSQANSDAVSVALQPDGRLLVGGYSAIPGVASRAFVVVRYLRDGQRDPTFGTARKATFGNQISELRKLLFAPDIEPSPGVSGSLVLVGWTTAQESGRDFAVVRQPLLETCGDGVVDQQSEVCDDGVRTGTPASCCTITCGRRENGTGCDDGDPGTRDDACTEGQCVGAPSSTTTSSTTSTTTSTSTTIDTTPTTVATSTSTTTTSSTAPPSSTTTSTTSSTAPSSSTTSSTSVATSTTSSTTSPTPSTSTTSTVATTSSTTTTAQTSTTTSTTLDDASTTSTSATTTIASSTSTTSTVPPCLTVRCVLNAAVQSPACRDETLPNPIVRAFGQATKRSERAVNATPRRARELRGSVRRTLKQVRKQVTKASTKRRPTLSRECAQELLDAIARALANL